MKSMTYALLAGGALALVASLIVSARSPVSADQSAEAAITEAFEEQTAAWNRADTMAFMEYYWKSPETEFVGTSGIMRGWDTVLARYKRSYPDAKAMGHLTFSDLKIHMLGADAAYAVGEYHLVREKDHPSGAFTVIVRKLPEGWRIVHDHSTAFPAEEPKAGN